MKKTILSLTAIFIISGCAMQPQNNAPNYRAVTPSDEARAHPDYYKHFNECDWYATSNRSNPTNNALASAAVGAGLSAAVGAIFGVGDLIGPMAGAGALISGVRGLAGSANANSDHYRQVMLQCMRDKGYEVY